MQVAFRADASLEIGSGHIMRCLTLADALRECGAKCKFICREHDGHMFETIEARGYQVYSLPKPHHKLSSPSTDLTHANWLGSDWLTDAVQTRQFLVGLRGVDWLIVDHYALDYRWESMLRSVCNHLMVIDDLADRIHDCDLLLDQTYGSSTKRYRHLTSVNCVQLHGPKFALLRPVYARSRCEKRFRAGEIERVLIYFGGDSDPMNLTGMALNAFLVPSLRNITLDIVVGPACEHKAELDDVVAGRARTRIYAQMPDLSELMVLADLAIGACGATTWERCCLGLPSILVISARNQAIIGEAVRATGAAIVMDLNDNLTAEVSEQVIMLRENTHRYLEMSDKASQICDGTGAQRVIGFLKEFY